MIDRVKRNAAYRIPNQNPPSFVPNKNQGENLGGPGGPGPGMPPGMGGGPGGPGPGMPPGPGGGPGGPGGPGGAPWQQPHQKLRPCVGKFAYLWLNNGSEYWFYVQSVTPQYLLGWRIRNGRWQNGRIAINRIERFYCNRRD